MNIRKFSKLGISATALAAVVIASLLAACSESATPASPGQSPTITSTPTASPSPAVELSPTELKYTLIERFGGVGEVGGIVYIDPEYYPVACDNCGMKRALELFPKIQEDTERFQTMLRHLGLDGTTDFTDEQKLGIYKEQNKLQAIRLNPSGNGYKFQLRTFAEGNQDPCGGPGFGIEGIITRQGVITILKQEPITLGPCPICLAADVLIDTPNGQIPVQDLREGMAVFTVDESGQRCVAVIKKVGRALVPEDHQMVYLQLDDGRELLASPGHPTADGRAMADLLPGDNIDGAHVIVVKRVPYHETATYDILPAGSTGFYWANGILIGSTLATVPQ